MREACIICPQHDNDGQSLQRVLKNSQTALAKQFGGYTCLPGKGGWINGAGKLQAEPVWQLNVAYEPSAANDAKLESVARYIGHEGRQQAVYVRFASGDVQIIETTASPIKHAA